MACKFAPETGVGDIWFVISCDEREEELRLAYQLKQEFPHMEIVSGLDEPSNSGVIVSPFRLPHEVFSTLTKKFKIDDKDVVKKEYDGRSWRS